MYTDTITKFIGTGLVGLGIFTFSGAVDLETKFIFWFSVAGFLLVIADYFEFKYEKEKEKEKEKPSIPKRRFLYTLYTITHSMSALSIILFPHFPFNDTSLLVSKMNNSVVLLGLGNNYAN